MLNQIGESLNPDPFDKTEKKTNHSLSQQLSLINTLNLTDHDSLV